MTEEEISRIKKHIEIHARQERGAVIITRVLRKAVDELEHIADLEKEYTELEKEISNLLSCKNCSENKGGYICQKEYENKCLAQKIQYIKELQEENAELKERLKEHESVGNSQFWKNVWSWKTKAVQLVKAKEIIKKFSEFANNEIEYDPEHPQEHTDLWNKLCAEAEQFLSEVKE